MENDVVLTYELGIERTMAIDSIRFDMILVYRIKDKKGNELKFKANQL